MNDFVFCIKRERMVQIMVFTVYGDPKGKGRPRFTKTGIAYTPKDTKQYEDNVRAAYLSSEEKESFSGPVCAKIVGFFKIPKNISKKKRELMIGTPYIHKCDADNLAKIILDSLNGFAYKDDSCVTSLKVIKIYGDEPKVVVSLTKEEQIV